MSKIYKSLLNKSWQQTNINERKALEFHQKLNISLVVSNLLSAKNLKLEEIEDFLKPTIKTSLPNPFSLLDMDLAVSKIIEVIKQKQKIVIFGDYDVDGATSSALLKRFFTSLGANVEIYIPDRILEGYGPNVDALLKLKKDGADLLITVDCGTVAFEPLKAAYDAGLEVIVIDHHLGAFEKPKAVAVINPNRLDETFPHKNLAAVGVSFLLAVAINKILREENFYQNNKINPLNLLSLLDLVALGTVCDVMTLTGINRAFVAQGLKIMKNRENIGIRTLCDIANLSEEPSSYHLGFVIGPRINAGGRVGKSSLGATLLSTADGDEAQKIAKDLDVFNSQRKDIEVNILEEAKNMVQNSQDKPVLFAKSDRWHQGVIGIVASRIKDLYEKPTIIIALKDGIGKASCRSISNVDLGAAIVKAKLNNLIIQGGGHKMAAGFSIEEDKIDELQDFLCKELSEDVFQSNLNKTSEFIDILDINSVNLALALEISNFEPFGMGNAKPRFLIKDLIIAKADIVGSSGTHVRIIFSNKNITGWQGRITAFAFGAMENDIGKVLMSKNKLRPVNIIGQINVNNWMGRQNVQIIVEDILE